MLEAPALDVGVDTLTCSSVSSPVLPVGPADSLTVVASVFGDVSDVLSRSLGIGPVQPWASSE